MVSMASGSLNPAPRAEPPPGWPSRFEHDRALTASGRSRARTGDLLLITAGGALPFEFDRLAQDGLPTN